MNDNESNLVTLHYSFQFCFSYLEGFEEGVEFETQACAN